MRRFIAFFVVAVVLTGCSSGRSKTSPGLVRAGGRAPTFDVTDVRNSEARLKLADFRGRPVVLNFWASWCTPCRAEMPLLESTHRALGDRVAFLGIDHQDTRAAGQKLLHETGVTYPSGFDPNGDVATAYRLFGMPSTVFVSADGRLLAKRLGEIKGKELTETIDKLFGVRTAAG